MSEINHQERAHARLSGSVASTFTKCTAAPTLWKGRERKATAFTREGTAAHELADAILTGGFVPVGEVEVEGEMVPITPEMATAVRDYVLHVDALRADADWHAIEQRFTLDGLWPEGAPEPMFGSADYVGVTGNTLDVLDLKFGKGVPVEAENNAQLLYYAMGSWFWLKENRPDLAVNIELVRVSICQPRVRDELSTWTIALIDLLMWGDDVLKKSVDDIVAGRTKYAAGKHCMFCLGKGVCPELAREAMAAAKNVFPPPEPETMSDDDIGEALYKAELLSMWMAGVRTEAETRLKNGKVVPGWKLVVKRAYRQWMDETLVLDRLRENNVPDDLILTPPELRSPAQVEKVLKSIKVNGPELLDDLIVQPEAGTTLVPETDKRPAVVTGAANVFPPVEA